MSVVLGVGVSSGAGPNALRELAHSVLVDNGFDPREVTVVATVDSRARVPAVVRLAEVLDAELRAFPAAVLTTYVVPSPSRVTEQTTGTPSVAEAAVLAVGGRLVVAKTARQCCTVAIGVFASVSGAVR